jgi:hypothetical protein
MFCKKSLLEFDFLSNKAIKKSLKMEIYIDPRCRFNYTNYYILGLKHLYKTAKIVFDVSYFPRHMLSTHLENNSSIPIIIDGKKIFIDADDKKKIDEEAYKWCDVYGKINVISSQLSERPKLVSIGPNFGIRTEKWISLLWTCFHNYLNLRNVSDLDMRTFVHDYLYTNIRRRPIEAYECETKVRHNYIFHASTLWYNKFAATDTNMYRGEFLKACKKAGINIEGGLFYVNSDSVLQEMPDYPKYKEEYKDFIYENRLSMDDYIRKTKESVVVFNTPSVCECHGWKLAEYLCMGKAIISTPLTREMPAPLEHGKHVHFVNSVDEIYDAVVKINSDEHYRKKLQEGARQYYEKWIAPEIVIQRLLEKVGEQP